MNPLNSRFPFFGVALIIFGLFLLVDRLGIWNIDMSDIFWPFVVILGLIGAARGFSQGKSGKIFWGTVMFLYALFFFLRSLDQIDLHGHSFLPVSSLVFGIAFLMLFFNNFREWLNLLPAGLLIGTGVAFILSDMGYLYRWEVWDVFATYWPVILVFYGIAIVMRRKNGMSGNQVAM